MDNETKQMFELILKKLDTMEKTLDGMDKRLNNIEVDVNVLKVNQEDIKILLTDLEPKNGNRHVEIIDSINDLRKDLSTVEIVTANNYADIAKLKAIK